MKHGFTNMIFTVLPIQSVTGKRAKRLSLRIENRVGGGGGCMQRDSLSVSKNKTQKAETSKKHGEGAEVVLQTIRQGGWCMHAEVVSQSW